MKKLMCLALTLCIICTINAQSTAEKDLLKRVDIFTRAHHEQWMDLEPLLYATDDSKPGHYRAIYSKPFINSFESFLRENDSNYARLRAEKFRQYHTPPEALDKLTWTDLPVWPKERGDTAEALFRIAFLRSLDPAMAAQIMSNIAVTQVQAATYATAEEGMHFYRSREIFGYLIYTRELKPDEWQVVVADRLFAVRFRFRTTDASISDAQYIPPRNADYAAIVWPVSLVAPADSTSSLLSQQLMVRWNNYPGNVYNAERYREYLQMRDFTLRQFNRDKSASFIAVRKEQLLKSDSVAPQLNNYKLLADTNVLWDNYLDTSFAISGYVSPRQWNINIITAARMYLEQDVNDYAKRLQRNEFFPSVMYAQEIQPDQWQVTTQYYSDAVSYQWNIRSGYISNIRYWHKE